MQIEMTLKEAETLREFLQQRIVELDHEINRTDSLAFKSRLQDLERTITHVLGEISKELSASPSHEVSR